MIWRSGLSLTLLLTPSRPCRARPSRLQWGFSLIKLGSVMFGVLVCLVLTSMDPGFVFDDLLRYSLKFNGKEKFYSTLLVTSISLFLRFVHCFQIHFVSVDCDLLNEPNTWTAKRVRYINWHRYSLTSDVLQYCNMGSWSNVFTVTCQVSTGHWTGSSLNCHKVLSERFFWSRMLPRDSNGCSGVGFSFQRQFLSLHNPRFSPNSQRTATPGHFPT